MHKNITLHPREITRPAWWSGFAFPLIAISLGLTAGVAMSEIAVRLFMPRSVWDFNYANNYEQIDPKLGWSLQPNVDIETRDSAGQLIDFKTNGDGILPREAKREKRAGI